MLRVKPFDIICVISINDKLMCDYVELLKGRQLGKSLLTYL